MSREAVSPYCLLIDLLPSPQCQMDRLSSRDQLTTDNVLVKVHEHSDAVLFPRLRTRFCRIPEGEGQAQQQQQTDQQTDQQTVRETDQRELAKTLPLPEQVERGDKTDLAASLPAPLPAKSRAEARPSTTGARPAKSRGASLSATGSSSPGTSRLGRSGTASSSLRPKPREAAMGIKILSKARINETLDLMKVSGVDGGGSCSLSVAE